MKKIASGQQSVARGQKSTKGWKRRRGGTEKGGRNFLRLTDSSTHRLIINCLLLTGYWLLTTDSLTLGAEEGAEGSSNLLWRIINFTILAVLLYLLLAKRVKEFLTTRREAIKTALEEAREAKETAERKYKEYEERLAILDKRIEEIFGELRAEGEIEKERIVEEARRASERIKEQARLTVAQEVKKAKEGIKEEVARLAIEMAEEILRREIQHSDQERLIKEYLDKIKLH